MAVHIGNNKSTLLNYLLTLNMNCQNKGYETNIQLCKYRQHAAISVVSLDPIHTGDCHECSSGSTNDDIVWTWFDHLTIVAVVGSTETGFNLNVSHCDVGTTVVFSRIIAAVAGNNSHTLNVSYFDFSAFCRFIAAVVGNNNHIIFRSPGLRAVFCSCACLNSVRLEWILTIALGDTIAGIAPDCFRKSIRRRNHFNHDKDQFRIHLAYRSRNRKLEISAAPTKAN